MGRLLKWLLVLVTLLLLVAGAGVAYIFARYPSVPPPEAITIERTPERLARGKYLFDHVAMCADCHSTRDFTRFAGPLVAGTTGQGGEAFTNALMGTPGDFYARNITPAGIGDWTDGEVLRAVTSGVNKHGEALFPLMPYPNYGRLDRSDAEAIVAYVRTLQPIVNHVPQRTLQFPMPLAIRLIPAAPAFTTRPSPSDRVAYGEYMVRASACGECHTLRDQGTPRPGMAFAGGTEFNWPWGTVVRAANITPDADTGIGSWTEDQFIQKFKGFENAASPVLTDAEMRDNTVMPWPAYAGMTVEDLGAIYTFLRTQKPVVHRVEKHSAR